MRTFNRKARINIPGLRVWNLEERHYELKSVKEGVEVRILKGNEEKRSQRILFIGASKSLYGRPWKNGGEIAGTRKKKKELLVTPREETRDYNTNL